MKTSLDYRRDFLCVRIESHAHDGSSVLKWYPVREKHPSEDQTLKGCELNAADSDQGSFVDGKGNMFQLASGGKTRPLEVKRIPATQNGDLAATLKASLRKVVQARPAHGLRRGSGENPKDRETHGRIRTGATTLIKAHVNGTAPFRTRMETKLAREIRGSRNFAQLNLRQKLVIVRQRVGYIQKRGHNELHDYNYVTAADLAGAVGDILAELGVLVVPRLESISHEPARSGRPDGIHLTHVVMNYSFVDVDTAEDITVKVAGEGADAGDKAPYKAMTGALKYALLQSFLLATGDDPENERINAADHSPVSASQQPISEKELYELRRLIEDTGTELERLLTYYKLSSLEEMTKGAYHRALELLKRKRAKRNGGETAHA
jgi:hypothetical protein